MCHRESFICENCATCEKGHTLVVSKEKGNTEYELPYYCERLHYDFYYEYEYRTTGYGINEETERVIVKRFVNIPGR